MMLFCRVWALIIAISSAHSAIGQYPGAGIIGRGYDVFGEYANSKSVSHYRLFDFSKIQEQTDAFGHKVPKLVGVNNISDHVIKTIEGATHHEYVNNLAIEMGLSGGAFFFKGSIDGHFTQDETQIANSFFYTYMDINTKWRVTLDTRNTDTLRKYLDKQFAADLASLPPQRFFDLYGTHFIAGAYLGGRMDYSTRAVLAESISKTEVRAAVRAKFMAIKGSFDLDNTSETTFRTASIADHLYVLGGNSEYANAHGNQVQYQKWAQGIREAPVLSGFDEKSLVPLWVLASDPKRQDELKQYYSTTLLSAHPLPKTYAHDPILDNTEFTQSFSVLVDGFVINKDCDNYLTGDEAGDFSYYISVYANGQKVNEFATREGYVNRVWSGNTLEIDGNAEFEIPLKEGAEVKLWVALVENDDLRTETVGKRYIKFNYPFSPNDLFNIEIDGLQFWKEDLYNDADCNATFVCRIVKKQDASAIEFGNKGWYEYEDGNYDQCLFYSREALKIDNALWYVHYNIALIYLIQENPRAFEKYKLTTDLCGDKKNIEAALQDILHHEEQFGPLPNSEPVKLWLKSKI